MRVLLTGAAGFIGFHSAKALLAAGHEVVGIDSFTPYYPLSHKEDRIKALSGESRFIFHKLDLTDAKALGELWRKTDPERVLHLAAQPGVRYSLEHPHSYIQANIVAFQNMLEQVRHAKPKNFVYASSSSVYGGLKELPFKESTPVNKPISLYAATKIANELVASTYVHLYGIPATGLRFFTVYGTHYRPDMAIYKFANLMMDGKPIQVFNGGKMIRDYTYVDDIVRGIAAALDRPKSGAVYNLGKGKADGLDDMIRLLEKHIGVKAVRDEQPIQPGDVEATLADVSLARAELGYEPRTSLDEGLAVFAKWFKPHKASLR